MGEQHPERIRLTAFILCFVLGSVQFPNPTAQADEMGGFPETNRPGVSLNTDLILPLFGIHYVDLEVPLSGQIDLTLGLVYQELPK